MCGCLYACSEADANGFRPGQRRFADTSGPVDPCFNGVQDGAETDIDCGGGTCTTCANGDTCSVNSDCTSAYCVAGVCTAWSNTYSCDLRGPTTYHAYKDDWDRTDGKTKFSIAMWLQQNSSASIGQTFMSPSDNVSDHFLFRVGPRAGSNTRLDGYTYVGGYTYTDSTQTIANDTWYLVVWAVDATSNSHFYKGTTAATIANIDNTTTEGLGTFATSAGDAFAIGCRQNSRATASSCLAGSYPSAILDEIAVFADYYVTSTDVLELCCGSRTSCSSCAPRNWTNLSFYSNITNYFRCGDNPADSSTILDDYKGSDDLTWSASFTYSTTVP